MFIALLAVRWFVGEHLKIIDTRRVPIPLCGIFAGPPAVTGRVRNVGPFGIIREAQTSLFPVNNRSSLLVHWEHSALTCLSLF
jgi:hypothetical protein